MKSGAEKLTGFGASVKRKEDPAFLRGEGQFIDDIHLPEMLHAAFVRSPYAHAKVGAIDKTAALALPDGSGGVKMLRQLRGGLALPREGGVRLMQLLVRGLDLGRRLGEAYFEIASNDLHDLPIGDGRSKKLGFAVNAVDAHD